MILLAGVAATPTNVQTAAGLLARASGQWSIAV